MKLLGKEDLLTQKFKIEEVDLGDDTFVCIREMSGKDRNSYENAFIKPVKKGKDLDYDYSIDGYKARLAILCLCDQEGNKLFDLRDLDKFSEAISAARLAIIFEAAQKLNGLSDQVQEDMLKNLEAVQDGNSNSDSVEN